MGETGLADFLDDLDTFAWRDEVCDAADAITGQRPRSKAIGLRVIEKLLSNARSAQQIRMLLTKILTEVYAETLKVWTRDAVDQALDKDSAIEARRHGARTLRRGVEVNCAPANGGHVTVYRSEIRGSEIMRRAP